MDNLPVGFDDTLRGAFAKAVRDSWLPVLGFVFGTIFLSHLFRAGGIFGRLVGALGLLLLCWWVWRLAGGSELFRELVRPK